MLAVIILVSVGGLLLVAGSYLVLSRFVRSVAEEDVLFVIAHPDDETMFFLPSCLAFPSKRLLCLSNGDFDGIGKTREKELLNVADFLGFSSTSFGDFRDGPLESWDIDSIALELQKHAKPNTLMVTFDEIGISGHANHIACYDGVRAFVARNPSHTAYKLVSDRSIIAKYSGAFGAALQCCMHDSNMNRQSLLLVNNNPVITYRAMSLHQSQFVWFRRLFVVFARCTLLNKLERV